jgi:hypothetical protein
MEPTLDLYEMELGLAIAVVANVVWILLMILAVVQRVFKETLVLGIIGGSFVLAVLAAVFTLYLASGSWNQSEFILYLAWWWIFLGVTMTLVPLWRWIRSMIF